MERIISTEIPELKTTRIICRRGDPTELTSLEIVLMVILCSPNVYLQKLKRINRVIKKIELSFQF